ncbi:MAG: hypothetical protein ABIJ74_00980 [archaeon]
MSLIPDGTEATKKLDELIKEVSEKNKLSIIKLILAFSIFLNFCLFWLAPDFFFGFDLKRPWSQIVAVLIIPIFVISIPVGIKYQKRIGLGRGGTFILFAIIGITLAFILFALINRARLNEIFIFVTVMACTGFSLVLLVRAYDKTIAKKTEKH